MTRELDMRGRHCPEPVVATKKSLDNPAVTELAVLLDNDAAVENVSRMGRSVGCEVTVESTPEGFHRVILKRDTAAPRPASQSSTEPLSCVRENIVVMVICSNRKTNERITSILLC